MHALYTLLIVVLAIVGSPWFVYQAIRYNKYIGSLAQRMGYLPVSFNFDGDESIWIHAVSVGEVLAWDSPPAAMGRGADVPAGKLISSLLGIVGRPPTAQSGKVKVPGRFGPRLYAVPSGPASSSLE